MSTSTSLSAREKGNDFFKKAGVEGLAPILQEARLLDALKSYNQANQLARSDSELASAFKNIAITNFKLAQISLGKLNKENKAIAHHYQQSIRYFNGAFRAGETCKDFNWRSHILSSLAECLEESIAWTDDLKSYEERLQTLQFLGQDLTIPQIAVEFQLKQAKFIFHDGAMELQSGDYKICLSRMKDCYFHLEEAKRLQHNSSDIDRNQEIAVLEQDIIYLRTTAESMQAREHGNQLLEIAVKEEEELNMDLIWDVIDWFKQATIFARELDLEQEAIALSRLGYVYDQIIKQESKAKTYFMRALQLADSLKPRTFATEAWFVCCVTTLKRYQDEVRQREEKEYLDSKKPVLEELKEELAELDEHENGTDLGLLKFVYTKYPPKARAWKKPEDMDKWETEEIEIGHEQLKSLLRRAVLVYHPDTVDEAKHGKKWKVLSEEIAKHLTQRYERLK
ncbi:predicted protein [Nematostella vectensis]|uniref:Uncharacterized protein n=1 Tax=Nematostella vectensis TaxID=45351 RepID=A7SLY0_NEMVE|nr:uncharacterized protein LOC5506667 [Nematostella vectensis]EDO35263.1 predicted protein [Nematostella vectensis]|eukprot:XP_001627363.1 predicted protein [Nematostella vectensis]